MGSSSRSTRRSSRRPPMVGLTYHFGIDQGPIVLAVENYRTGLIWDLMRRCQYVAAGVRRAGFSGGWL